LSPVSKTGPDPNVNLLEEIHEIRRIWLTERGDWEDSIPKIHREATDGSELEWIRDDTGAFGTKEGLLHEIWEKHRVPQTLVQKLLDAELQTQGMNRTTINAHIAITVFVCIIIAAFVVNAT
jgi:DNA sulfur modification protein DndC